MPSQSPGREAELFKALPNGRIKCTACARLCEIPEGKIGLCGIRGVEGNKLRLFAYGRVIAGHVDPIEKKPVTHYNPGAGIFSIATTGCNWLCHPRGTRIMMANGGEKNIEDVIPGDSLWSYEIESCFKIVPSVVTYTGTRDAPVWEVAYGTEGLYNFFATREHPVLTLDGWKEVGQLQEGDHILKVLHQNTAPQRRFESVLAKTVMIGNLTGGAMLAGNASKDIKPLAAPISAGSLRQNTQRSEELARPLHRLESQKLLFKLLDGLDIPYEPWYRIKVRPEIRGSKPHYVATAAILGSNLDIEIDGGQQHYNNNLPKTAQGDSIRDRTLKLNGWDILRIPEIYLFKRTGEVQALIAERIAPVARTNKREWMEVKSVKQTKRFEQVYSLECIPNHNYVADGILVHNCQYCQNYDISQRRKIEGTEMTPSQVAETAAKYGAQGIAYTYNEPSIFIEFAKDCGLEAHKRGIFNVFVSNGYDTPESVGMMGQFLDCITVDFKGSGKQEFVRRYIGIPDATPVFQTLKEIRDRTKVHVEITDLIVPKVGDDLESARKLCRFVYDELGPDTPVHFLRFHPDYKMMEFGYTPVETLEKHHAIAKEAGLKYAYLGNVPGHPLEHTYCPECRKVAVKRYGFSIEGWNLDADNCCKNCGYPIAIIGKIHKQRKNRLQFIQ